jgi:pimeloyl-ACP methyl ester carboxylesterase
MSQESLPLANYWLSGEHDGLVDIGGARIYLHSYGPDLEGQPSVIFISGHGSCSASWLAVTNRLKGHARSYLYDR